MIKTWILSLIRTIKKNKVYSFINIAGLAIGMACCILMFLFIRAELSVDGFHEKIDRIASVRAFMNINGGEMNEAVTSGIIGTILKEKYPEVEDFVRFKYFGKANVKSGKDIFYQRGLRYADENVFDMFTWNVINGNPKTALNAPYKVAISEEMAEKYFRDANPINNILEINKNNYTVTAVFKNVPENSSIPFNMLVSMKTLMKELGPQSSMFTNPTSHNFRTYLLMKPEIDLDKLNARIKPILNEMYYEKLKSLGTTKYVQLKTMRENYLKPLSGPAPIEFIYMFSIIAIFVLLIACVNFMTLSTARYMTRAKEVGLRKVSGASRKSLIIQFLAESIFLSFASLIIALVLTYFTLPLVKNITGWDLSIFLFNNITFLMFLVMLTTLVGFIAGIYPAFFLSGFKPSKIIKGQMATGKSGNKLRQVLVVFQFVISVTLIISTLYIVKQLNYLRDKDHGFVKDDIIVFNINTKDDSLAEVLKYEIQKIPSVRSTALSSTVPCGFYPRNSKLPEGYAKENAQLMIVMNADEDFIPTMGIKLLQGRNFSRELDRNACRSVIIDETAMREFGWSNAVGKTFKVYNIHRKDENDPDQITKRVVGVVKDFNTEGVFRKSTPLFIDYDPVFPRSFNKWDTLSVKIDPTNMPQTITRIETTWKTIAPEIPLYYHFLDEYFQDQLVSIEKSRSLYSYFAILAIFIAALGLFGMSIFNIERRRKEVAIRKVLGCRNSNILILLNSRVLRLILLANIIAYPVSYYFTARWLEAFPSRISINISLFFMATIIVMLISIMTTLYHTMIASRANPIDSIRSE